MPESTEEGKGAPEDGREPHYTHLTVPKANHSTEGQNVAIEIQNPDALNPPPTDDGNVVNLKWSFALSNMALDEGGYIREQV